MFKHKGPVHPLRPFFSVKRPLNIKGGRGVSQSPELPFVFFVPLRPENTTGHEIPASFPWAPTCRGFPSHGSHVPPDHQLETTCSPQTRTDTAAGGDSCILLVNPHVKDLQFQILSLGLPTVLLPGAAQLSPRGLEVVS